MTATTKWIAAIVGLLAANVIAMVTLAIVAHVGHSEVIADYYEQGVHYDDVLAQAEANRALGWHVGATLVDGQLEVSVRDAAGAPLDGASVRTTGYPRAYAAERLDLALAPTGVAPTGLAPAGLYHAVADRRPGRHDLTITIDRGGARYVEHLVVEAR